MTRREVREPEKSGSSWPATLQRRGGKCAEAPGETVVAAADSSLAESDSPDCLQWLQQLSAVDYTHLTLFAERRLASFGLPSMFAEDLVGKAIASVVFGLYQDGTGRRPRKQDVSANAPFLNYLRGTVASTVEAFARRAEHRYIHTEIYLSEFQLTPNNPEPDITLIDLKTELFKQLKLRAPDRLTPTICRWEEVFLYADHVPRYPSRKHSRAVRLLAAEILLEIEPELVSRLAKANR